ncbi:MAG: S16 family serine protease [Acidimicrobiales bacterium]
MESTDEPGSTAIGADTAESLAAGVGLGEAGPAGGDPAELRKRMWRFVSTSLLVAFFAAAVGGFLFKTDYVALVPGSARDTEPLLEVADAEEYPSDGQIFYTTVRLVQNPSLWEYLWYTTRDDAQLVEQETVLQGQTVEESRERNLQLMTSSKDVAVAVALGVLGYETIEEVGVIIAEVVPGTAASDVVVVGDILVSIDGTPIVSASEVVDLIGAKAPGDELVLVLDDGDGERTETVILGARDDDPEAPFLGVGPRSLLETLDEIDLGISIDTDSVGGPSAGLAFTLAILDQLTPGELTGGTEVAVTGTIEANGGVGAVGGVTQKAAAVRDADIEVFIVPRALGEATLAEVTAVAGDDVEVVPVWTITEALEVLEGLGGNVDSLDDFALADS